MSPLGLFHTALGVAALVLGAVVLARPKGTRTHRIYGYSYVVCMLLLNATAFGIYRLMGGFGPFHVMALISLAGLVSGILPVLKKPVSDGAMVGHLMGIGWSYIGLCAATAAEIAVRVPALRGSTGGFVFGVMASTGVVVMIGSIALRRYRGRLMAQMAKPALPMVTTATLP
ncbi:MAG: DUF2306 domain-containing protein [Armatimonadetes bacterium]|nr:DUF2306 domain-containing protein [Armatimonadota bacterium]